MKAVIIRLMMILLVRATFLFAFQELVYLYCILLLLVLFSQPRSYCRLGLVRVNVLDLYSTDIFTLQMLFLSADNRIITSVKEWNIAVDLLR